MNETHVNITRRQAMADMLLESISYVNPKPVGKPEACRALYSVRGLTERQGWPASTIRALLGALYGRGQVVPISYNGAVYWRATTTKERETL